MNIYDTSRPFWISLGIHLFLVILIVVYSTLAPKQVTFSQNPIRLRFAPAPAAPKAPSAAPAPKPSAPAPKPKPKATPKPEPPKPQPKEAVKPPEPKPQPVKKTDKTESSKKVALPTKTVPKATQPPPSLPSRPSLPTTKRPAPAPSAPAPSTHSPSLAPNTGGSESSGALDVSGGIRLPEYYARQAIAMIAANFRVPVERQKDVSCVVSFTIRANGEIESPRLARSCGDVSLDAIAVEALRRTGRFAPLPQGLRASSVEAQLTFSFLTGASD